MYVFFFKQKTAYEMRISDWSSDVCSSDLNSYQKHSEYIVQHSDLQGFSQTDKLILAALLRLHRGKFAATSTAGLPEEWREPVRRLAIIDRKSVVEGKSVSARVDLGGSRIIKKKNTYTYNFTTHKKK